MTRSWRWAQRSRTGWTRRTRKGAEAEKVAGALAARYPENTLLHARGLAWIRAADSELPVMVAAKAARYSATAAIEHAS